MNFSAPWRAIPVRIADGPLAGYRWSLATGRRYRSGEFERERVESIAALVQPGDVVFDVGAHRGYVSLVAAKSVGPEGRVFAFEPSAVNYDFLLRHARWNTAPDRAPIEARHVAIAAQVGAAWFGGGRSLTSSLQEAPSRERVEVETLDHLVASGLPVPTFVKIDVEGAESKVLAGSESLLSQNRATWLVATHSRALYFECRELLELSGLRIVESDRVLRALEIGWEKVEDPEILAIPEDCQISPEALERFVRA